MSIRLGPLVSTYSIVARDAETGHLGVAVQSCYFSVGTEVSWSEPGIGAIATQAIHEIARGAAQARESRPRAIPIAAIPNAGIAHTRWCS